MKRSTRLSGAWMSLVIAFGVSAGCNSSGSFSAGVDKSSEIDGSNGNVGTGNVGTGNVGNVGAGNVGTGNDTLDTGAGDSPLGKCVVGDKVNFVFPADIQSCIDSGKVYNWVTRSCTNVGQAKSYTCDFEGLYKAAKATLSKGDRVVDPSSILEAKKRGGLLIACGEKSNTDIIIAQWYYPSVSTKIDDCNFSHNTPMVISACYRFYPAHDEPPDTNDPAEIQKRVQTCLTL